MASLVEVEGVSKWYRRRAASGNSLRELRAHKGGAGAGLWALDDVSLQVAAGECAVFLGRNGSGKSTLLKCLARTTRPTKGLVRTRGRVAALIQLGAGFHPELSGRENVFLASSLLGVPKAETLRQFDAIVEFAEMADAIDAPVKHYSSGMYARLGFSVAVHTTPDILLVDEVLAVGDEVFQQRCFSRIDELKAAGTAIVVVTHSMPQARSVADRVVVLEQGHVVADGPVEDGIAAHRASLARQAHTLETAVHPLDEGVANQDAPAWVHLQEHEGLLELRVQYSSPQTLPERVRVMVCDSTGMPRLVSDQAAAVPLKLQPLVQTSTEQPTTGRIDPDPLPS
jgi:ABC-type polysaccharide/polyol phosphate transport system ATPase subunit